MMKTPKFIAMYPVEFLADVGHLGNTELGIYWRLLLVYYRDGGPLPSDVDRLRRMAMAFSPEECRSLEAVVAEFFILSVEPDGTRTWRHKRADIEIDKASNASAKKSAAAQETNRRRWGLKPEMAGIVAQQSDGDRSASRLATEIESKSREREEEGEYREGVQGEGSRPALTLTASATPRRRQSARPPVPSCPYDSIIDLYHDVMPELPKVLLREGSRGWPKRSKGIREAWAWVLTSTKGDGQRRATTVEEGVAWFRVFFERARENDFVMGRTRKTEEHANWRADLDYLLSPRGMKQVMEKTA